MKLSKDVKESIVRQAVSDVYGTSVRLALNVLRIEAERVLDELGVPKLSDVQKSMLPFVRSTTNWSIYCSTASDISITTSVEYCTWQSYTSYIKKSYEDLPYDFEKNPARIQYGAIRDEEINFKKQVSDIVNSVNTLNQLAGVAPELTKYVEDRVSITGYLVDQKTVDRVREALKGIAQ